MDDGYVLPVPLTGIVLSLLLACLFNILKRRQVKSKELEPRRDEVDHLEATLNALQDSTIAIRASKAGSATLKNLWRLNNPFVSDSPELQQAYRRALMKTFSKTDNNAWAAIARSAAVSLEPFLRHRYDNGTYTITANVKDISRHVALVAVLKGLFDIDHVPTDTLMYIGSEIHRLTVGKKQYDAGASRPDDLPQDLQRAADRLIDILRGVFSEAKESNELARTILCSVSGTPDHFNPLDLVIPAFEAPWRGVYYTLLAVLQPGLSKPDAVLALRDSAADRPPSPAALAIAYESLRLYPPIRRVRREQRVDIEAVQRDPQYWGPTADTFDPWRFLDGKGEINTTLIGPGSAWMPFAVGAMKCPSAGGYSARMIAVLAGEVLRQLFPGTDRPQWTMDGPEWDSAARTGQALRAGRDEYASVSVIASMPS
ncbi:cytochrome P450 [Aspergillus avenaceus]|uniref:Cytochrome P450 n=1 Tax=Aspergillus avenaceus TaxID=36643 RepID=A0A5N6TXG2_ASPAV|nr:cytochrome P450 [Aspergillus avenaceus]